MEIIQAIRDECDKISRKRGFHTPYEIIVSHEKELAMDKEGNMNDIIIEAGNPVKVVIPILFIARTILADKPNPIYIRDRLERMLEKLPRLHSTLGHIVPTGTALILQKEAKKWIKAIDLPIHDEIADDYLEVEYIVRVTDKLSGISFSAVSDKSPRIAESEAKTRLSRIILNDESLRSFRRTVIALSDLPKVDDKVAKVTIQTGRDGQIITRMER